MKGWQIPEVDCMKPGPRGAHASLAIGTQILVFGGADRSPLAYNDLWQLETAGGLFEWTFISQTVAPGCTMDARSGATLSLVGNEVFLFGGTEPVSGVCFNDLKVLNTVSWTWSDVEVEGLLPPARHSHTAGCLAESCLLVYGGAGYNGPLSDVWVFNPMQRSWSRPTIRGAHPAAREMHTGLMLDDTRMLVYGGRGANNKVLCDVAILDASKMAWTQREPTPFARCAHSSVLISIPLTASPATPQPAATTPPRTTTAGPTQPSHPSVPLTTSPGMDVATTVPEEQGKEPAMQDSQPAAEAGHNDGNCGKNTMLPPPVSTSESMAESLPGPATAGDRAQPEVSQSDSAALVIVTQREVPRQRQVVLVYGGFGGEAVEGDVIQIDPATLDVEVLTRGPRQSNATAGVVVPCVRFAHSAAAVPWQDRDSPAASWVVVTPGKPGQVAGGGGEIECGRKGQASNGMAMVVFGGVEPGSDLNDISVWQFS